MLDEKYSLGDMMKFYCNIKIEYRPKKRTFTIPLLFIVSFVLNLFIINMFLKFTDEVTFYAQIVFMAIMFAYYISLLCQNPRN